jgi:apolipoprotein N-acyltransferase
MTSKKPELIVNVTNDAWYGNSAGPYQHLVQARFRAIESGLPLVRSANTGISAVIDPVGNIVSSIALMKEDILNEKIPHTID